MSIREILRNALCRHKTLSYVSRWPEEGTTGRGKVWKTYCCDKCGKLFLTSNGIDLYPTRTRETMPFKKIL